MRTGSLFLTSIGLIALLTVAAIVFILQTQKPGDAAPSDVPMVAATDFQKTIEAEKQLNYLLAGVMVGFSVLLQISAWAAAAGKLREVKRGAFTDEERSQHLDAIEVYFDLPLYFGLLGTVVSFILVTLYPEAGLMFAYISTALGIVVSVVLRLGYLTPYRQQLISIPSNDAEAPTWSGTRP